MGKQYSWSKDIQSTAILDCSRRLRFNDRNKQFWFDLIGVKDGMRVLEVGCGSGHFLQMLKKNFDIEAYGVDLDAGHIEYAKQSASQNGLDINFQVADIRNLPFDDNYFDVVYSYTVVEHLPFNDFITDQTRILKAGGRVVMMTVEAKQQAASEYDYMDEEIYAYFDGVVIDKPDNIGIYSPKPKDKLLGLNKYDFENIKVEFKNLLYYCPDNYFDDVEFGLFEIDMARLSTIADAEFVLSHSTKDTKEADLCACVGNINKKFEKRKELFLSKTQVCDYQTTAVCAISGIKK